VTDIHIHAPVVHIHLDSRLDEAAIVRQIRQVLSRRETPPGEQPAADPDGR